jgi:hypothetical protein
MFFDPHLHYPKLKVAKKILQKKLGFRMTLDVIPLDPSIVHGSHGLPSTTPQDAPLLLGHGPEPTESILPMTSIHNLLLNALNLNEDTP